MFVSLQLFRSELICSGIPNLNYPFVSHEVLRATFTLEKIKLLFEGAATASFNDKWSYIRI